MPDTEHMSQRAGAILSLFLGACVCFPASARGEPLDNPLDLKIAIVGQRFCPGDMDLSLLHLDLLLSFTNVGDEKVILYKKIGTAGQITVRRDLEAEKESKHEWQSTPLYIYEDEVDEPPLGSKPDDRLVIVSPGEIFRVKTNDVIVSVLREGRTAEGWGVRPGTYYLTILVNTWPPAIDLGKLRRDWQEFGILFSEAVESNQLKFTIPEVYRISKCVRK